MDLKEEFYAEKNSTHPKYTKIEKGITDPVLVEIDKYYTAAAVLSYDYAQKYRKTLATISVIAPVITFLFLLYDEAEQHWLIVVCIALIIVLYAIYRRDKKQQTHKKYLEYRILAESIRLQYFLSIAGVEKNVSELLPWFVKNGLQWIDEVLMEIPVNATERKKILDIWIVDQRKYHESAYEKTIKEKKANDRIKTIILILTIFFYVFTLFFECYMFFYSPYDFETANKIRACLKIGIGTMSVIAIFSANYYGKKSLSNKIDDHGRMAVLYRNAEEEISTKGETPELIMKLAREFLIENSTWYAFQKKNKPDFEFG